MRSSHPAFGRGTLTLLSPKNRKVLAYIREYDGDTVLCVVNLAHSLEAVELDLSHFSGRVPVELSAGSQFPPIGELTYLLTVPPFGFYWFALATTDDQPTWHTPAPEPLPEFVTMIIRGSLAKALVSPAAKLVEDEALPQYIAKRRWFGLKDQPIKAARVTHLVNIGDDADEILLTVVEVKTTGATTHWLLPLAVLWEDQPSAALANMLAVARVRRGRALVCSRTPLRFRLLPIDLLAALLRAKNLRATTAYCAFSPLKPAAIDLREVSRQRSICWPPNNPTAYSRSATWPC